ncbi:hypothetical protein AB1Y20_013928 [Prymnesium parvum]|uniref:Uncharacterized protein n=1 Tax=Prymnesium parvum TaxID=97485 RepID=A0AB34IHR8_PRYPA
MPSLAEPGGRSAYWKMSPPHEAASKILRLDLLPASIGEAQLSEAPDALYDEQAIASPGQDMLLGQQPTIATRSSADGLQCANFNGAFSKLVE